MTSWRHRFLILLALILSAGHAFAANGARQQRVFNSAVAAFQDGDYPRAETELAQFVHRFPDSTNVPEAVLLEAQSAFKQDDYTNSIVILAENMSVAGTNADQFVYWTGEAQFAGNNFPAAADTFGSLAQNFPGSPLRLRVTVEQAAALAWANQWPQAISLLGQTNGIFQRAAQLDPNNDLISRGRQLQAQGLFIEGEFTNALAILNSINPQILTPDLDAGLERLVYQLNLATTNFPATFAAATNLFQTAKIAGDNSLMAESVVMRASVLEEMNRIDDAIAAYTENLTTNAPDDRRRQAIQQITRLAIQQKQYSQAENSLSQFTNSPDADVALLSLGELQLRDYATLATDTNLLAGAHANLDAFISRFPNNPMLGEAYFDRGWCFWLEQNFTGSLPDFQAATNLPPEELTVAKFKTGDAQFAQGDLAHALENYLAVANDLTNFPATNRQLGQPVLYQILRVSLALTNLTVASNAMAQILASYPASEPVNGSEWLYGENLAESGQPAAALVQFQNYDKEFTNSPLRPQVEFTIARCYVLENDWVRAIAGYTNWLVSFPTNSLRPQVMYALALANSQAGNETNAFASFTNFVAQFPANEFAPQAQWWIADHFFRLGGTNYVDAEKNYEYVYQNFPTNQALDYAAQLMAGRSAAARQDFAEAIHDYFSPLEADTNCPEDVQRAVLFEHGKALMEMPSSDTNSPLANFQMARGVFNQLTQKYPTNEFGALAWFYTGNCDVQLTNYDIATNDYAQVLNTNIAATITTRSMAQVGLGKALEQKAGLVTGTNQTALVQMALNNYLDVFYENNLRDNETADPYWTEEAGIQALHLIETSGLANTNRFIDRMEQLLPELRDSLEKMRSAPLTKS
jgi:TolA-binding protein